MRSNKRLWWLGAGGLLLTGGLALVNACGDGKSSSPGQSAEGEQLFFGSSSRKDDINTASDLTRQVGACHAGKTCPSDKDAPCEKDNKLGRCVVSCPEIKKKELCWQVWYCSWLITKWGRACRRNERSTIEKGSTEFSNNPMWRNGVDFE